MKKAGIIGVGAIGKGVLKHLIKHGFDVVAYDKSESGKSNIAALGGKSAQAPDEVARHADILFLSLPGPQVVRELLAGERGIINSLKEGSFIADLSTIDPSTTKEMAALCSQRDISYFDCPVSGGPDGADAGTLTIMVGGPEEKFHQLLTTLKCVGSNIEYIGDTGLAQTLKLCHNMVVAATTVALGEAFATGVKQGLDIKQMADVIGKSVGSSRTLAFFGPNIINDTYENIKFMLNHMHKDMELYVKMAQENLIPSFIGSTTYNLYHAAKTQGKGNLDHTAVCQVIENLAETKLVNQVSIAK
ncbi:NAD(P)-dependent oxidoreductase [Paenibacillus sp. J2TS4]|uniref:NAD(P)-dependent oxidoreductase n=1 Tax=Paenibacillus sp. J2TS4 TaxID=2807194 RepID=UPI001B10DB38|nr:NAD(P)-dependent oxidoreductase [Paenibacillus sp. J2TS4]GIP34329.1 3-hydroxyisobutyrate dehydrogenase [Paenibacillus sp. J2TS4]